MGRYNPIRWKCDKRGCFNQKKRPKIEQFAQFLPGNIAMGDLDAMVEINGHFLLLEWKESCESLKLGQLLMFERLMALKAFTVLCIVGDAETMKITEAMNFKSRKDRFKPSNFAAVGRFIQRWSHHAQSSIGEP